MSPRQCFSSADTNVVCKLSLVQITKAEIEAQEGEITCPRSWQEHQSDLLSPTFLCFTYYVPQWRLSGTPGVIAMIMNAQVSPLKGLTTYLSACDSIYIPWKHEGLSQYSINVVSWWLLASKTCYPTFHKKQVFESRAVMIQVSATF